MIVGMINNVAPSGNSQDHNKDAYISPGQAKGPAQVSNRAEMHNSSATAVAGSSAPLPKKLRSSSRSGRRVSLGNCKTHFRSSLQTIESTAASSVDVYHLSSGDSKDSSSKENRTDMRVAFQHTAIARSHPDEDESNRSLMVSFSRLNEKELTHLRKWNRRLQRTEVFNKYYFPAKWEANEMEALVRFLKLEDPSAKASIVLRGGSLRESVKNKLSPNDSRLQGRQTSQSWQAGENIASESSLSFTSSFKDSAGKIAKLLIDPDKRSVDPVRATNHALDFIFFPYVHDPKSVLLKRGSIFLHDDSLRNERELMVFTHGFLLANVVLKDAFSLFLALSDREFLTAVSLLDYLENRFREMDDGDSGEVKKWKLVSLFADMGIPMGGNVLDELIQTSIFSATSDSQCEKVNWEELHKALTAYFVQQNDAASTAQQAKSMENFIHFSSSSSVLAKGSGLKRLLRVFQGEKKTRVEHSSLFSDVARIDSLNICHGDDSFSKEVANTAYARTSFSITLHHQKDPLIFVCSKPEHRDSWVDAFKPGVIHALSTQSDNRIPELGELGWQHLVIRSSLATLVIMDDAEALECACQDDPLEGSRYCKAKLELNLLDEYNGYSPLHYATILGHTDCIQVLLEAGSKATLEDQNGLSPIYHALRLRNDGVADVLEMLGHVDRTDDLRKLIGNEIQADELKNLSSQQESGLQTHAESSSLALDLSASENDGNIDALLMHAASQFGG